MMTLSIGLRVQVPTVGGIQLVLDMISRNNTFIVMAHNLNWLIPTLYKTSIGPLTIIYGVLRVMANCCSYSPKKVSLSTITLHYYSDNFRDLSRLRFYAVLDDFDIRNALTTNTPYVDVAEVSPGEEPTDRRNISINANFSTTKVLMYKYRSSFMFAVSEVEFFKCSGK